MELVLALLVLSGSTVAIIWPIWMWISYTSDGKYGALPLTFWKVRSRLMWKATRLKRRVLRAEAHLQELEDLRELASHIKARQERLAAIAYKNHDAFLKS